MSPVKIAFLVCFLLVLYPYVLYPLVVGLLARLVGRPVRRAPFLPPVSFVVCAHNEEAGIETRLTDLLRMLDETGIPGEVILVSDGSTDRTCELARSIPAVRLIELPLRAGKAEALTRGVEAAAGEIVVFADVRQAWAPEALELLLENFADPEVGAVSGDLVITSGPGAIEGVGLYWRFEKWLRAQESLVFAQVGVTGAISAVRRHLFRPVPQGTMLDDVYWPLRVAMEGHRVVHDSHAIAFDRFPDSTGDEFLRKVRTLAGNFQLLTHLPGALLPWRNPIWLQWLSHKLARLVVPWALIGLLATNACLLDARVYQATFALQLLGYAVGVFGLLTGRGGKLAAAGASFLVLNAAAWVSFWVWLTGGASRSWHKVAYTPQPEKAPKVPAAS